MPSKLKPALRPPVDSCYNIIWVVVFSDLPLRSILLSPVFLLLLPKHPNSMVQHIHFKVGLASLSKCFKSHQLLKEEKSLPEGQFAHYPGHQSCVSSQRPQILSSVRFLLSRDHLACRNLEIPCFLRLLWKLGVPSLCDWGVAQLQALLSCSHDQSFSLGYSDLFFAFSEKDTHIYNFLLI